MTRSFESRRKDGKITNMIFNEWINEYKSKSVSVEGKVEAMSEEKMEIEHRIMAEGSARKFTPIILTKNY